MVLMIDNYDSFTYNLVQYFEELGSEVVVARNDHITIDDVRDLHPSFIVISPGPCTPDDAGISVAVVNEFAGRLPLLGVCLGHQSIAQAFGGRVVHARQVMHGKPSMIYHDRRGLFRDLPCPIRATRYHSLIVVSDSLPECLEVCAWTADGNGAMDEVMAIRHRRYPIAGLQFHPESILTEYGHALLRNFIDWAKQAGHGAERKLAAAGHG